MNAQKRLTDAFENRLGQTVFAEEDDARYFASLAASVYEPIIRGLLEAAEGVCNSNIDSFVVTASLRDGSRYDGPDLRAAVDKAREMLG